MTERRDLLAALHPITRALRRIEEAAAAREGIGMWQYAILSVVAERPGCNQREAATYLQYSPNRIVADLHDLERRRWLDRRPGADRRSNVLALTAAGDAARRRIQAEVHRQEDALLAGLPAAERARFDRAAHDLARAVRDSGPTPPSPG